MLLPGWLLNTASQTPDTHVARQWRTARAGCDCRPEVSLISQSTREQGPLSQTCNTRWLENLTKACREEWLAQGVWVLAMAEALWAQSASLAPRVAGNQAPDGLWKYVTWGQGEPKGVAPGAVRTWEGEMPRPAGLCP